MTFTTKDLDGPGQSPKSLHQVGRFKELPQFLKKDKRRRPRKRKR